jgi:hypothetical protein
VQAGISRTRPGGIDVILSGTGIEAEMDVDTTCTLEEATGHAEPCSGRSEAHEDRCVLKGVERELLARPRLAHYLLTLRRNLEQAAPTVADASTTHGH